MNRLIFICKSSLLVFPRNKGGHIDDGHTIGTSTSCPNCKSAAYRQTVSTESCTSCGLIFDYWVGIGNEVYNKFIKQRDEDERYRRALEEIDNYIQTNLWKESFKREKQFKDS